MLGRDDAGRGWCAGWRRSVHHWWQEVSGSEQYGLEDLLLKMQLIWSQCGVGCAIRSCLYHHILPQVGASYCFVVQQIRSLSLQG